MLSSDAGDQMDERRVPKVSDASFGAEMVRWRMSEVICISSTS
jgi:hypothetical protein